MSKRTKRGREDEVKVELGAADDRKGNIAKKKSAGGEAPATPTEDILKGVKFGEPPEVARTPFQAAFHAALRRGHPDLQEGRKWSKSISKTLAKEIPKQYETNQRRDEALKEAQYAAQERVSKLTHTLVKKHWLKVGHQSLKFLRTSFEEVKVQEARAKQEEMVRESECLTQQLSHSLTFGLNAATKNNSMASPTLAKGSTTMQLQQTQMSTASSTGDLGQAQEPAPTATSSTTAGGGTTSSAIDAQLDKIHLPPLKLLNTLDGARPLRAYQQSALRWLIHLYSGGLNGILADEMGLGKTVQTIALLCYFAEHKQDWGPHLIVVPTTVVLNWEMELKRWAPGFKVITYIGTMKERANLRKGWTADGAFNVCITSYNALLSDRRVFRSKAWGFLVLDEAHTIKNWRGKLWQGMFELQTTHRLLLTGTPLQNSVMELWSLLRFLLPDSSTFENDQEFQEWFSNPMDDMVAGRSVISEKLVTRLHSTLRPFMLRRLKVDVEQDLPSKTEVDIKCKLSKRQADMYRSYMRSETTHDMIRSGQMFGVLMSMRKVCNHPDLFAERPVQSPHCMTQRFTRILPKECFILDQSGTIIGGHSGRSVGRAPLRCNVTLRDLSPLNQAEEVDAEPPSEREVMATLRCQKVLEQFLGMIIIQEMVNLHPNECYDPAMHGLLSFRLGNGHKNWDSSSSGGIKKSVKRSTTGKKKVTVLEVNEEEQQREAQDDEVASTNLPPVPTPDWLAPFIVEQQEEADEVPPSSTATDARGTKKSKNTSKKLSAKDKANGLLNKSVSPLGETAHKITQEAAENFCLRFLSQVRSDASSTKTGRTCLLGVPSLSSRWYFNQANLEKFSVYTPKISIATDEGGFTLGCRRRVSMFTPFEAQERRNVAPLISLLQHRGGQMIQGSNSEEAPHTESPPSSYINNKSVFASPEEVLDSQWAAGGYFTGNKLGREWWTPASKQTVIFPDKRLLLHDCGKFQLLSTLLPRLRSEDHRCLIFTQFTKMLDLLEKFLALIGFKYLRIDGSTKPELRQRYVERFNADPKFTVMILSTRSGGIGINLVGADTVIFYDSDWNPAMDLQAQDRAHRIGQTKPVTIYRLISEGTVEEKILKVARERIKLNNVVVRGGRFNLTADQVAAQDGTGGCSGAGKFRLMDYFNDFAEGTDLGLVKDYYSNQEGDPSGHQVEGEEEGEDDTFLDDADRAEKKALEQEQAMDRLDEDEDAEDGDEGISGGGGGQKTSTATTLEEDSQIKKTKSRSEIEEPIAHRFASSTNSKRAFLEEEKAAAAQSSDGSSSSRAVCPLSRTRRRLLEGQANTDLDRRLLYIFPITHRSQVKGLYSELQAQHKLENPPAMRYW